MKAQLLPLPRISRWSGGQTAEIALWPPEGSYQCRDFLWRLSSATVECESSVFTSLPDYNRIIALLGGELALDVENAGHIVLRPGEPYRFDGGVRVESRGRAVDFNLMLRKGRCEGEVRPLHEGEISLERRPGFAHSAHLLYAADPVMVRWDDGGCIVPAGGCLHLSTGQDSRGRFYAEPRGRAMLADIWY